MKGTAKKAALLVIAVALLWVPSAQAAESKGLSLLSSASAVKVGGGQGEDAAETHLALFNENARHTKIKMRFEASSDESVHIKSVNPKRLPAGEVTRVAVEFEGLADLHEALSGELVISGGPDPIAQSVEVTPAPQPSQPWPWVVILGSLGVAGALVLIVFLCLGKGRLAKLGYASPGTSWEGKSWATTLAAAGGLLGTVLAGVTYPPYPEQISKAVIVNLSLFCGALVVLSPFLFQALRRCNPDPVDRNAGRLGRNRALLGTSAVTIGGVVGQLAVFILLSWELLSGTWESYVVVAVLGLLILCACRYFVLTMNETVGRNWRKEEEDAKQSHESPSPATGGAEEGTAPDTGGTEFIPEPQTVALL